MSVLNVAYLFVMVYLGLCVLASVAVHIFWLWDHRDGFRPSPPTTAPRSSLHPVTRPTTTSFAMDDEGEHCQDCGKTYGDFVYRIPDDVWEIISPKPDKPGAGLLCPMCTARRATDAGIYLEWEARHA